MVNNSIKQYWWKNYTDQKTIELFLSFKIIFLFHIFVLWCEYRDDLQQATVSHVSPQWFYLSSLILTHQEYDMQWQWPIPVLLQKNFHTFDFFIISSFCYKMLMCMWLILWEGSSIDDWAMLHLINYLIWNESLHLVLVQSKYTVTDWWCQQKDFDLYSSSNYIAQSGKLCQAIIFQCQS